MNPRPIQVIKKADKPFDGAKQLRESASQMVGQANRTNNLFVDVLLEMREQLMQSDQRIATLEKALGVNSLTCDTEIIHNSNVEN